MLVVTITFNLLTVQERNAAVNTEGAVPFVPTVRDMLRNGPYVNYILIRFFIAFGNDLMINTMLFYIK